MKDAVIMTIESVRTRQSTNEALVTFAIPLEKSAQVGGFLNRIGKQVAAAFHEIEGRHIENIPSEGNFSDEAQALKLSKFFKTPDVIKAVGSDEEYLDWLRNQPCMICGDFDYHEHGKNCEAAHVRRVNRGSGTSIKPPYSAVPLCHVHHAKQHNEGESSLYESGYEYDDDFFVRQANHYLRNWAWETLKQTLGYDSWKHVPPPVLLSWARDHKVSQYLPAVYLK